MKRMLMVFSLSFLFLVSCSNSGGAVTVWDVLKQDKDADIIKYESRVYANLTDVEWFEKTKSKHQKGKKIGEIKNIQTSPFFFGNFSATKLPKGTVLYSADDAKEGVNPGIIIAEVEEDEFLYYMQLLGE